jgi:uncharacterized protein YbjT (DUF2867 family)
MKVLVAGASGFIGSRLCPVLADAGHEVLAMTRHPHTYAGGGQPVYGDVTEPDSLTSALADCSAAYYLVHSLDQPDFQKRDRAAAEAFCRAAADVGLGQVVYLGGLGDDSDSLSAHLQSRREVEHLLAARGVPVTTLRAGVIVGHGGLSWELTRQLVEHLPAMILPRWVSTRTQPIAVQDVISYLAGVLDHPDATGRTYEIGGPDVLQYRSMLQRLAKIEGRKLLLLPTPLLSPRLSSWWLALVTDVDVNTGRALIDSMTNEVVVRDTAIRDVVPLEPMSYDEAVLAALADRAGIRWTR